MKTDKIILTTTASFSGVVESSDLQKKLLKRGVKVVLHSYFNEPFPFDKSKVFAIVAGHTPQGTMLHVGPKEAVLFPNLRVVSPFGVGVNHIDIAGLEKIDIPVKIIPSLSKRTVAELTILFVFSLARRIGSLNQLTKNGIWKREEGVNLVGKTLGIIGFGAIGKEVAKLGKAIGMKVIANDIVYDEKILEDFDVKRASKKYVIENSDFLTLHVPYTNKTKNLLDKKAIARMKKGSYLINAARGEVIDEKALFSALKKGSVAGAALDVFSIEPPFSNKILSQLIKLPNVIATPHVGAFTRETRYDIAKYICDQFLILNK